MLSTSTETDSVNSTDSADTDRVSDIDGLGLFDELRTMCNILPDTVKSPLDILVTFMLTVYMSFFQMFQWRCEFC